MMFSLSFEVEWEPTQNVSKN